MNKHLIVSIKYHIEHLISKRTSNELFQIIHFFKNFIINFKNVKKKIILERSFLSNDYLKKILPEKDYYLSEFKNIFFTNNPLYFVKHDIRELIFKNLEDYFPDFKQNVIINAESVLNDEFDILGRKHHFLNGIDWFYSLFNEFSWPFKRSSDISWILNNEEDIDLKYSLRLNYHQEFVTLGLAFYLTKDEKYSRKFYNLIINWIKRNPPNWGINWIDLLEISHRIVFWIFALSFFETSKILTRKRFILIAKSLLHQVYFVKINSNKIKFNHLIGEQFSIFLFSQIFKSIRTIKKWNKKSKNILLKQIKRQTQEDGVNIEQTTNYHRMVLEIFSLLLIIDSKLFSSSDLLLIERMFDFWKFVIKPDGIIPLIGDNDEAHFIPLNFLNKEEDINLDLLKLGTILFNRNDFKIDNSMNKGTPLILLLLGSNELKKYEKMKFSPTNEKIKYFDKSGYIVGKSNWTNKSNYLFFDMGHFGPGNSSHDHSDVSNIIYSYKGKPILIDSGTYKYNVQFNKRNIFRSSKAHNVISINGNNQAKISGTWSWENVPNVRHQFIKKIKNFKAIVEHNGYKDYIVKRYLIASNDLNKLKIIEEIIPLKKINKETKISSFFHFPEDVSIELGNNFLIIDSNLKLNFKSNKNIIKVIKGNFPYSPYYGVLKKSQLIEFNISHKFKKRKSLKIEFSFSNL